MQILYYAPWNVWKYCDPKLFTECEYFCVNNTDVDSVSAPLYFRAAEKDLLKMHLNA